MELTDTSYTEKDYYNLPDHTRAELIEGQFYALAAPSRIHQALLGELYATIHAYLKGQKGSCRVYPAPFAVKLFADDRNIVEPDISVICSPGKLTGQGCLGAPDWIVEIISPSTSSHDYIRKLNLYAKAGVREYWIVDPENRAVQVFLQDGNGFLRICEEYGGKEIAKAGVLEGCFIDLGKVFPE